jgi:uncharacterized protein
MLGRSFRRLALAICLVILTTSCSDTRSSDPLVDAADAGDIATAQRLLNSGHDVNASILDGYSALMDAAGRGDEAMVELLLTARADVNQATKTGWTALMAAASGAGNIAVVRHLIEAGANACARQRDVKQGPPTAAALALEKGHPDIASYLDAASRC